MESRNPNMQKLKDEQRALKLQVLLVCLGIALAVFLSAIGLGVLYVQAKRAHPGLESDISQQEP